MLLPPVAASWSPEDAPPAPSEPEIRDLTHHSSERS
jgi:hypothetical protein